jgi:hypothetical protein
VDFDRCDNSPFAWEKMLARLPFLNREKQVWWKRLIEEREVFPSREVSGELAVAARKFVNPWYLCFDCIIYLLHVHKLRVLSSGYIRPFA